MLDYKFIMDKLCEIADHMSRFIGERFLYLNQKNISYKENQSEIVSDVDIEVEKKVVEFLSAIFPNAAFIGEENNNEFHLSNTSELTFIIDPIDGTSNYVYGINYFGFSIGVASHGVLIGGIIAAPALDEIFCAMKNCKSFYKIGEKNHSFEDIIRDRCYHQNKYLIGTTYPCINLIYNKLSKKVSVRIFGSIALTICYALIGKLDGFVSNRAKIWDIAGAIGIANALNIKFFIKYNSEKENYSLIFHQNEDELENLRALLDF